MRSLQLVLATVLLITAGCTTDTAGKKPSDACHAGGGAQCRDMVDQNRGGQSNGGGMGGGSGGGMM